MPQPLIQLNRRIEACERCPRLITYCRKVAREKRASFRDQTYWGKPVPNFLPGAWGEGGGARLLIAGLAPAAHGANRTGRMFTGDRSGDFLYKELHRAGLASRPTAVHCDDGLTLYDTVITAAIHCAPPGNKPARDELANCSEYLSQTINALLPGLRVILTLGGIGHDTVLREYQRRGWIERKSVYAFRHAAAYSFAESPHRPALLCCYHPSQQNTFTGRLTPDMLYDVLEQAKTLMETP